MTRKTDLSIISALLFIFISTITSNAIGQAFSIDQILSVPFPSDIVSSKKTGRIAWISYDRGRRNIWTAAETEFKPLKLTNYTEDNGDVLLTPQISDDGSFVIYVKGGYPDRDGWIPNPTSDPDGREQAIWAVSTSGSVPFKLAIGHSPVLSPSGEIIVFIKNDKLYSVKINAAGNEIIIKQPPAILFNIRGNNHSPKWSPDSRKIAFACDRYDHSYIAVYDLDTEKITWMSPGIDYDSNPAWSPDSKSVAFIRTPGYANYTALMLSEGHTLEIIAADAATGKGNVLWQNSASDAAYFDIKNLKWAQDDILLFEAESETWNHIYSISTNGGDPVDLTPGKGIIEQAVLSNDGQHVYFASNKNDIDRRHIGKTAVNGGNPIQLTGGGIETYPVPLSSGNRIAFLSASATQPQTISVMPASGGNRRNIWPEIPSGFPIKDIITPQQVILDIDDGMKIHCLLYMPKDAKPGSKLPAMLYVHGGPRRQMLSGWHPMHFYTQSYAFNQRLANKGYVVLSVNYRGGTGYGRNFRLAPKTGPDGAEDYNDILAAGMYLKERPETDSDRIGIWGASYGGFLTSLGLAKNSDIFAAGVDLYGIHVWNPDEYDPSSPAFSASPTAHTNTWTSPVLLVHGDNDRTVDFSNIIRLTLHLRLCYIYHETLVFPDETHELLLYKNVLKFFNAADDFFDRMLENK